MGGPSISLGFNRNSLGKEFFSAGKKQRLDIAFHLTWDKILCFKEGPSYIPMFVLHTTRERRAGLLWIMPSIPFPPPIPFSSIALEKSEIRLSLSSRLPAVPGFPFTQILKIRAVMSMSQQIFKNQSFRHLDNQCGFPARFFRKNFYSGLIFFKTTA